MFKLAAKIASKNNKPMQIRVPDRLIVFFCMVFKGFKRVFKVFSTKESPYFSSLKQEFLDEI